jgi:hypothetical protein
VYMGEGTTSSVMAADRPCSEFMIFTASVRNILDTPSSVLGLQDADDAVTSKTENTHDVEYYVLLSNNNCE